MRVSNFYSLNYVEYEGYRNNTLSIKECIAEIKPYSKEIINNLKKSDTWKIQFGFISLKTLIKII